MMREESIIAHLPYFLIIISALFLPVFFVPVAAVNAQQGKLALISMFATLALVAFVFKRLKEGTIEFPKSSLFWIAALIPAIFFISSLFSAAPRVSFVGVGTETGTFLSITFISLFFLLPPLTLRSSEQAFGILLGAMVGFAIAALFQFSRLIFGFDFLSFGVFNTSVANLVGKWNDLAIFSGLTAVMSLIFLEHFSLTGMPRYLAISFLIVSLFFLVLVNFLVAWGLVVVLALLAILYKLSLRRKARLEEESGEEKSGSIGLPIFSTGVLVLAIVFVAGAVFLSPANSFTGKIAQYFKISHLEARPSWSSTMNIVGITLGQSPVLGVGPNRFNAQWVRFKPDGINESAFWSVDFNSGIGTIPTFLATTGMSGLILFALFLAVFLYHGLRSLFYPSDDRFAHHLTVASFFAALFGWLALIFYTPGIVLSALTFLFTGVFLSLLLSRGVISKITLNFASNPKSSFIFSSLFIMISIGAIAGSYILTSRLVAEGYYREGLLAFQRGEGEAKAEMLIKRSFSTSKSDRALRSLAELKVRELSQFLRDQQDLTGDEAISRFRDLLGAAIDHGRDAVEMDGTNYENWITLGGIYGVVVPLGIEGAYENSRDAYEKALELNPTNPEIDLALARIEQMRGNTDEARKKADDALKKKSNYSEVVFFLTQLEIGAGNVEAAISAAEASSLLAPNDPVVFFQLGLLYYHREDYNRAISALERAVGLNNVYANAMYFLGLSYEKKGRVSDSIALFEEIEKHNPDNQEVKLILENLRAGRAPFENAEAPLDEPPEERDELPFDEE